MQKKKDRPRPVEVAFVDTKCDGCGCELAGRKYVWFWNEHTACSRACVVKAKERADSTGAVAPAGPTTPI